MDILIVEDSLRERERLSELFENSGFSVESCESVDEAEQIVHREALRLVVLDIGLSDRSGTVLFQHIRKQQPDCKVIIFTGNPSPYLKQRFLSEGAVEYVLKGSPNASSEAFSRLVGEYLDSSSRNSDGEKRVTGTPLNAFLREHLTPQSQLLFYEDDKKFAACHSCGSREYAVTFSHQLQVPPEVLGKVICLNCGSDFDPTLDD